jgi:hypothetical protein
VRRCRAWRLSVADCGLLHVQALLAKLDEKRRSLPQHDDPVTQQRQTATKLRAAQSSLERALEKQNQAVRRGCLCRISLRWGA